MNNSIYINYNLLEEAIWSGSTMFVMQFVNWTKTHEKFD